MNFYSYLSTISRLWSNRDGIGVARFVTLSGNHASNPNLHIENPESSVERSIESPLDEVIIAHIKVLYYLNENRKDNFVLKCDNQSPTLILIAAPQFNEAYKYQSICVQAVVKLLQAMKEENWCLPVMYVTCLDLRVLALKCELIESSTKRGQVMEKAAECLMSCFRVCAGKSGIFIDEDANLKCFSNFS